MTPSPASPPVVALVGRKNSGKTTLTVALAAELKRRGLRVASAKHGHHAFEIDQPGRDSWRHFHDGGVEAVLLISSEKLALIARAQEPDDDPRTLVDRYFAGRGYDLVLVEGYKRGPFPKVEIFRRGMDDHPLFAEPEPAEAPERLALVTDTAVSIEGIPTLHLDADGSYVHALAELIERKVTPLVTEAETGRSFPREVLAVLAAEELLGL
jgi:molybdopterin-guanine dinucleotide biosynthesis protein MobB